MLVPLPIILLLLIASANVRTQQCNNPSMTDEYRAKALEEHNRHRSDLASGKERSVYRAKNLYKFSWDCALEAKAQEWADRCVYEHSENDWRNSGENLYQYYSSEQLTIGEESMTKATDYWWKELADYGIIDSSYKYSYAMSPIGHWTQMAWGKTSKLACGVASCPQMNPGWTSTIYVVCHYYEPANYPGQQIYEFGNGCSQNSDCTLYSGSTCERSTNLCIAPGYTAPEPNPRPKPPVTPSPSGQRCTSNVMTDTLRKLVAKRHNALRRDVALGKLRNVDTARNMYYLDYDCDLERRAQEYAERCDITSSPPGSISYDGTNKKPGSVSEAITSSMQQWAQPVKDGQVRAEIFSQNNPNPSATQMIWGSTTRVGCGVAMNCNVYWEGYYYETVITVCMYEQPGNRPGEQIYERGRACNSASDCTTFPGSSCKKKIGLCRKK